MKKTKSFKDQMKLCCIFYNELKKYQTRDSENYSATFLTANVAYLVFLQKKEKLENFSSVNSRERYSTVCPEWITN